MQFVFTTSEDDRVCPQCSGLAGLVFDPNDDLPDIPVHSSCRCRLILFNESDTPTPAFIPDSLS